MLAGSPLPTAFLSLRCLHTSPTRRATATACGWIASWKKRTHFSKVTTRKCISISIEMPSPKTPSIISKNSARTNIEFLENLPPGSGDRKANHAEVGEITLAQMLHEWALHDIGHIRQVAELVRARKYLNGAGPLGKSYQLKP